MMRRAERSAPGQTLSSVSHSLSRRLLRSTLVLALGLGLLISVLLVVQDYRQVAAQPDRDMQALAGLTLEPASAIVFALDSKLAEELLKGSLKQPAIQFSRISLNRGERFAERQHDLQSGALRPLSDSLFGRTREYRWPLYAEQLAEREELGELLFVVDTFHYGKVFLERALLTLLGTLFYALLLSLTLLWVFSVQVSRPLFSVIGSIAQVDMDCPEQARLHEPQGHADSEIGLLVRLTNQHLQAIALTLEQLRAAESSLKQYSDALESKVAERTLALSQSVEQLQQAQSQLIESEKLAALGGLVAGVAHEVNTPLGIAVTATSVLSETLDSLRQQFTAQTLTSQQFSDLLAQASDSTQMLVNNLQRAARLVRDFKQTAVDQVSEARSQFQVEQVLRALIASLHPETRKVPVEPLLECPPGLQMNSLPGVLTQVLANLILNSVRHAFADQAAPLIEIRLQEQGEQVLLDYRDNGCGVPESLRERIFEPFFTTKRGSGGSGLGLNIVYNLVTRKLGGKLEFSSQPGQGVHFRLSLPRELPAFGA